MKKIFKYLFNSQVGHCIDVARFKGQVIGYCLYRKGRFFGLPYEKEIGIYSTKYELALALNMLGISFAGFNK